jgi:ADP-dependent NAD(P)H-hydrate dehydratase / NAD(P)H-hydrate epimerase
MTISQAGWRRHALLTPQQMGEADRQTIAGGIPGIVLMEKAGLGVADVVSRRRPPQPLVVLCGPGNNGGDGFVAARVLTERGWPVRLALPGSLAALRGDAAEAASRWNGTVEPLTPAVLDGADLAVDGIFGAGLTRPVEGVARAVIEALIERRLPVVAIDVPSGIDGASGEVRGIAPRAAATVTFFRKKPGHLLLPGRSHCGEIVLVQIGIAEAVLDRVAPDTAANDPLWWLSGFPWPSLESHKYTRGHALVAGGAMMTGAARLAAKSAARTGAGLVTLAAPEAAFPIYAASLTGVIVHPVAGLDDFQALLADKRRNAVLIGPGAEVGAETRDKTLSTLTAQKRAMVWSRLRSCAAARGAGYRVTARQLVDWGWLSYPTVSNSIRRAPVTRLDASRISSETRFPSSSLSRMTPGLSSSLSATAASALRMMLSVSVLAS